MVCPLGGWCDGVTVSHIDLCRTACAVEQNHQRDLQARIMGTLSPRGAGPAAILIRNFAVCSCFSSLCGGLLHFEAGLAAIKLDQLALFMIGC